MRKAFKLRLKESAEVSHAKSGGWYFKDRDQHVQSFNIGKDMAYSTTLKTRENLNSSSDFSSCGRQNKLSHLLSLQFFIFKYKMMVHTSQGCWENSMGTQ